MLPQRLVRAARAGEIKAFRRICPHVVGRQRDRSIGLIEYFRVEIRLVGRLSECVEGHVGEGFSRERVGVIRVGLERLAEQVQRGIVAVTLLFGRLREDRHIAAQPRIVRSTASGFLERAALSASALTSSKPNMLASRATI